MSYLANGGPRQELVFGAAEDEARVAAELGELGWECATYGTSLFDEQRAISYALRHTVYPIRHCPDLMIGRDRHAVLAEVVRPKQEGPVTNLEQDKAYDLDTWAHILPVYLIDVTNDRVWRWQPYEWRAWVRRPGHPRADVHGSGTPFVEAPSSGTRPLADVFRRPT